jgi:GxxExxY protein
VLYDWVMVGTYCADLLVEGQLLIELKALSALSNEHVAQCINYLRATGLHVCLLINFGTAHIQVKRIVY